MNSTNSTVGLLQRLGWRLAVPDFGKIDETIHYRTDSPPVLKKGQGLRDKDLKFSRFDPKKRITLTAAEYKCAVWLSLPYLHIKNFSAKGVGGSMKAVRPMAPTSKQLHYFKENRKQYDLLEMCYSFQNQLRSKAKKKTNVRAVHYYHQRGRLVAMAKTAKLTTAEGIVFDTINDIPPHVRRELQRIFHKRMMNEEAMKSFRRLNELNKLLDRRDSPDSMSNAEYMKLDKERLTCQDVIDANSRCDILISAKRQAPDSDVAMEVEKDGKTSDSPSSSKRQKVSSSSTADMT